jgi:phage tail-like protein
VKESEIAQLLPGILQRTLRPGNPLRAVLGAMETLHGPAEDILREIDSIVDPNRTPDAFVAFLARWVDLEPIFDVKGVEEPGEIEIPIGTGLGRLRQLIQAAAQLSRWRGTRGGLLQFLETATGATGFSIDESVLDERGEEKPFHIRVHAPRECEAHRRLIERIIDVERPAYVTWDLVFD